MNPTNTENNEHTTLLTLEEARARLRISLWSLRRLLDNRDLPTVNIGRRRFIRAEDITALVESRAQGSMR